MKAIFVTGGKQYMVEEGQELYIEKLENEEGSEVVFDEVLYVDGKVGTPTVKGAKVVAKVLKHGKQKKVLVFKYKPKKKYRKTQGHRQPYTKVEITKIKMPAEKAEAKDAPKYLIKERTYSKFSRSFTLPDDVDAENITAKVVNGVLHIDMPRKAIAAARKIAITAA